MVYWFCTSLQTYIRSSPCLIKCYREFMQYLSFSAYAVSIGKVHVIFGSVFGFFIMRNLHEYFQEPFSFCVLSVPFYYLWVNYLVLQNCPASMYKIKVIVPQQAREVTQLLCLVHTVEKGLPAIQDYQVPLSDWRKY